MNSLRDETGVKVFKQGMPILLDLYKKRNIKSTFFFTSYIAKKNPEIVKMVLAYGHEIGSHGKSHLKENGFDIMPFKKQKSHLEYSKKLLEDISGNEVISFRAPALRVNKNTAMALIETGYHIDSSISSQRFDFFFSFGTKYKLNWIITPRLPYKVNSTNIFKKGESNLVEIPVSALLLPYIGTTMRIFPKMTSLLRFGNYIENKFNDKPVVFLIHPNEFIDESNELRKITKRSYNPISYLVQDIIRSRLKIKNLGENAVHLYMKEIDYYIKKGFQFMTLKKYYNNNY